MAKAPTIAAGPSSGNDSYSATEEQIVSGALILNVLANDARKSTLHSVDNGEAADLVIKDQVLISEQSRLGASIWITSDGRIGYALDSAQAQSLAAGETFQDSFLYAIRLSSGSLVWQSVQVTITGTNDGPVARADSAAVSEDALSTGSVALNDSDVDHGAVLSYATAGQVPAGFAMTSAYMSISRVSRWTLSLKRSSSRWRSASCMGPGAVAPGAAGVASAVPSILAIRS